jgi:hypothetical protein
MDSYHYAPLNAGDIRLLRLLSGQFSDPLLVDLSYQVSLRNASPTYEARHMLGAAARIRKKSRS